MTLLLQNLSYAYEHIREMEKAKKLLKWKNLLEEVYEQHGLSIHSINGMYFNLYVREYYLDCELIRGERLRQGMTQVELAEGIYECVESLSRVENGKESPNRIKYQQLMERLGVDKSRYNGHERLLALTYDYRAEELTRVPFRNEAYKML